MTRSDFNALAATIIMDGQVVGQQNGRHGLSVVERFISNSFLPMNEQKET
jgi:hypothetical protein